MRFPLDQTGQRRRRGKFHGGRKPQDCTRLTMSMARRSSVIEASRVRKAAWADSVTLSSRASGSPAFSGSLWNTSRPAWRIWPLFSASISAASSTSAPRAVLIRIDAGLHPRDARLVEEAAGLVVEREVERDDVGVLQQVVELDHRDRRAGRAGAVPGDHLHAHALGDARHLGADAAEPDDAERLAEHLHAFAAAAQVPARMLRSMRARSRQAAIISAMVCSATAVSP